MVKCKAIYKSLMYSKNIVGSIMGPSGTPALTGYSFKDVQSKTTQNRLLLTKDEIRPNTWLEIKKKRVV